jgi:hypothetical protein
VNSHNAQFCKVPALDEVGGLVTISSTRLMEKCPAVGEVAAAAICDGTAGQS